VTYENIERVSSLHVAKGVPSSANLRRFSRLPSGPFAEGFANVKNVDTFTPPSAATLLSPTIRDS
jgi:hypothetical protein